MSWGAHNKIGNILLNKTPNLCLRSFIPCKFILFHHEKPPQTSELRNRSEVYGGNLL